MTRPLLRTAVRLLPTATRDRYADEIAQLLDDSPRPVADAVDVVFLAAREHLEVLMRRPSACPRPCCLRGVARLVRLRAQRCRQRTGRDPGALVEQRRRSGSHRHRRGGAPHRSSLRRDGPRSLKWSPHGRRR